jgi:hypothetical protein
MNPRDIPSAVASNEPYGPASDISIPVLVARVYESAPFAERGHLLEPLLRPLGVLSLLGIAGGVFASVRFRSAARVLGRRGFAGVDADAAGANPSSLGRRGRPGVCLADLTRPPVRHIANVTQRGTF